MAKSTKKAAPKKAAKKSGTKVTASKAKVVRERKAKAADVQPNVTDDQKRAAGLVVDPVDPETPAKKRGRPKGKKRGKKIVSYAWFVRGAVDEFGEAAASDDAPIAMSGPFSTEEAALEDIQAVAPEGEVEILRTYRVGKLKTTTKLV